MPKTKTTLERASDLAIAALRASKDRDDAIREAINEGNTVRAIAAAVGLSPARIHQIGHRR